MTYIDFSKLLSKLSETIILARTIVRDYRAIKLLELVERPDALPGLEELRELVLYGYANKVLLTFPQLGPGELRSTTLYRRLWEQRRRFLEHLVSVVEVLDRVTIDFVVFKTLRPVMDAPVDIDIVVGSMDEAYEAVQALRRRFRVEVWDTDAYSIGVRIADFGEFIDFYVKPHVADIVYLDPKPLLRGKVYLRLDELGNDVVPVPRPADDFCAVLGHAIIKEGLVTLNDILTLLTYYKLSSWSELLNCLEAQKLSFAYSIFFSQHFYTLPQKLRFKDRILSLSMRSHKKETLESIPHFFRKTGIRMRRLAEHSKRITYVRGFR